MTAETQSEIKTSLNEQTFLVERKGKFFYLTADQLTDKEREGFQEVKPDLDEPSIKNPEEYLQFLRQFNTHYDYSGVTATMVEKAIAWALSRSIPPSELNPAQIILASEFDITTLTPAESAVETIVKRINTLKHNKAELGQILNSPNILYFHSTPTDEHVASILSKGLYCDSKDGLQGTAAALERNDGQVDEDQLIDRNILRLSDPHRGYRYVVIVELPSTPNSTRDETNKTAQFTQMLDEPVGGGQMKEYDAVMPAAYITGYIDLDTGIFTANPNRRT